MEAKGGDKFTRVGHEEIMVIAKFPTRFSPRNHDEDDEIHC